MSAEFGREITRLAKLSAEQAPNVYEWEGFWWFKVSMTSPEGWRVQVQRCVNSELEAKREGRAAIKWLTSQGCDFSEER